MNDGRVVRVLPDVPAIDREFDYLLPGALAGARSVGVGAMVRVPLHGRRVGGWVTAIDVEPELGVTLVSVAKVSGVGPSPEMIELCRWASWRWAGRLATFLRAASPPSMVVALPPPGRGRPVEAPDHTAAFDGPRTVLRVPPGDDPIAVAVAAAKRGDALVVCPSQAMARAVVERLRRQGVVVASFPREWAAAAAGGRVVVGARAAAFAPMPAAAAFVVIDEHDEALQNEGSPTWHAREVVLERARRGRVPAVLTSPCPSLEAVARTPLVAPTRAAERRGWPVVEAIDRRDDDPGRASLFSGRLVRALRGDGVAVCVLNRTGRARLLACRTCASIAQCERCDAAVAQESLDPEGHEELRCPRCGTERPVVCQVCGATAFKRLRMGVARARDELEALLREPVVELTGRTPSGSLDPARVYVGTEAALHRVPAAAVVAFLDLDNELLARRYRAAEEALALLARAARLVGGRDGGGRVVAQTRVPDHEVIRAAIAADPGIVMEAERTRRERLGFPPAVTMALVGGAGAPDFVEAFGAPLGVEVRPSGDEWLLVAEDRRALLDQLATTPRPSGRLRLQIDPMRLS
ncbi:MAG TPA: hypothetical protein VJM33_19950 [Microthrixaceae bacterium]|nr:hypothetical protein [Microthrixaceae bacterium]